MARGALVGLVVLFVAQAALPPSAIAQDDEARGLFLAGRAAFDQGRYEDALDRFREAHRLSGRPELLYNIGQAADRLRRDREALEAFEGYLEQTPSDAPNRSIAQNRVDFLREQLARREAATPARTSGDGASGDGAADGDAADDRAADGAGDDGAQDGVATHRTSRARAGVTDASESTEGAGAARPVPSPAEAARASAAESTPAEAPPAEDAGDSVASKWWFWAIVGAAAVGGVVAGVVLLSPDPATTKFEVRLP